MLNIVSGIGTILGDLLWVYVLGQIFVKKFCLWKLL